MLVVNQCLDKLSAMQSDFAACGMLPAQTSHGLKPQDSGSKKSAQGGDDNDNDNGAPVDSEDVLGHVVLAKRSGKYNYLTTKIH